MTRAVSLFSGYNKIIKCLGVVKRPRWMCKWIVNKTAFFSYNQP